jgi:hypothetical protein
VEKSKNIIRERQMTKILTHLRVVEKHPSDLLKGTCKISLHSGRGDGAAYVSSFPVFIVFYLFFYPLSLLCFSLL